MGATLQEDNKGIWVLRISGILHKKELDAVHASGVNAMGPLDEPRVLVLVEDDFCGWMESDDWTDITFFKKYGDRIAKIAIIGDSAWKNRMMMFLGAGIRPAPVRFFPRDQLSDAYDWLI